MLFFSYLEYTSKVASFATILALYPASSWSASSFVLVMGSWRQLAGLRESLCFTRRWEPRTFSEDRNEWAFAGLVSPESVPLWLVQWVCPIAIVLWTKVIACTKNIIKNYRWNRLVLLNWKWQIGKNSSTSNLVEEIGLAGRPAGPLLPAAWKIPRHLLKVRLH